MLCFSVQDGEGRTLIFSAVDETNCPCFLFTMCWLLCSVAFMTSTGVALCTFNGDGAPAAGELRVPAACRK